MVTDLLPPNATPFERAASRALSRLSDVPVPIADLWNPAACSLDMLPWLAWSLSVDQWEAGWPEATKRAAVAGAIDAHRRKGTRAAVSAVLARIDTLTELVEWWQFAPARAPHTFWVSIPLNAGPAAIGGDRTTAAFVDTIVREVGRVKPLREEMRLAQHAILRGAIGLAAVVRTATFQRRDLLLAEDTSQPWAALLQTENGEPLADDAGIFFDERPA